MPDFVHLHTHTEFSLLDGLSSPKALASYAAQLGMTALAITDHGVMYGIIDFYKACRAAGIKPIIGIETYLAHGARQSRNRNDGKPYHLVLLAQNQSGYQNLLELASLAQLEGFYYKPRIDKETLAAHSEGVLVLSACLQGEVPQLLLQGQEAQAREAVRWYQQHFPGRFYLEIQDHDIPEQRQVNPKVIALAREMHVPLVATNDIHYARRDQFEAHDVLLCVGTGKTVNEPNRMRMSDNSYYMRSPDEMAALFKDTPDALENTVKIAEQCNVEIQFAPPYHVPKFPVPESCGDSQTYLRHLCDKGMAVRYGADATRPDYIERLEYELTIIHEMGFDDYFLIVWDLCQAAERMDIWWNVRGSGAGSVVAYTLNITNVDPFKNRLFFERFLNPGRISMPDIDLDYPDDRREELIAYTAERYGKDKVAGIITFGTLGARAAIRDVGRAMDIPLSEVDRVARLVPNLPGKPVSIQEALETIPELKDVYKSTPYIKTLLDTATQLEGVARHASTHAAGVLVSDLPLTAYLPLNRPTKGEGAESALDRVSQWAMEIVDALGMLKVDFLGLRTLTHMRKACEWIEKEHGRKFDLNTIPYERVPDDPQLDAEVKALYDLLASGETTGVFQVESAGMRRVLRDMRPYQFQHIVAAIALYRPGPMDNIPTYIKRLHGEETIQYHHPLLEQALNDTCGVIIYQEQIMQIAVDMAGYEPGEADGIRKAVAKKKRDLMDKHHKMFREGCIARTIPGEVADAVWGDIEFFARYGFNRAHATDYAVITAQTAYLKAHYPLEFMTALMTTERNNIEKLGFLVSDARRTGMQVLPPCVNASDVDFTIEHLEEGRAIRIGLGAIKNVGAEAVRVIVTARQKDGPFESLDALANRVDLRKLNRRTLECLIQAGALDAFGPRAALLAIMDGLLSASSQIHTAREQGQLSLFGSFAGSAPTLQLPPFAPPIAQRKLLEWEKDLLGTYISEHPLTQQERELLQSGLISTTLDRVEADSTPGQQLVLLGSIQRVRRIQTKKGATMAFLTLEGSSATLDAVIFPKTYERYNELFTPGRVIVVCGKLDQRPDREDHPVMADWIKEPHELLRPVEDPPLATDYAPLPSVSREVSPAYQASGNGQGDATAQVAPLPSAPAIATISAPPEEPPEPANTLYITIQRTGDNERDFHRVSQVHNLLVQERGRDQFVVILQGNTKPIALSFPNTSTRYTPALRESVESLVGNGNVKIVAAPAG